jgi:uncharacterized membrane protein
MKWNMGLMGKGFSCIAAGTVLLIAGGNLATANEENFAEEAMEASSFSATAPTFYADVQPVFKARCTTCHGAGKMRPSDYTDYNTVVSMKDQVYQRVVVQKNMPIGMHIDPNTLAMINTWFTNGLPAGDPVATPPAPTSGDLE